MGGAGQRGQGEVDVRTRTPPVPSSADAAGGRGHCRWRRLGRPVPGHAAAPALVQGAGCRLGAQPGWGALCHGGEWPPTGSVLRLGSGCTCLRQEEWSSPSQVLSPSFSTTTRCTSYMRKRRGHQGTRKRTRTPKMRSQCWPSWWRWDPHPPGSEGLLLKIQRPGILARPGEPGEALTSPLFLHDLYTPRRGAQSISGPQSQELPALLTPDQENKLRVTTGPHTPLKPLPSCSRLDPRTKASSPWWRRCLISPDPVSQNDRGRRLRW